MTTRANPQCLLCAHWNPPSGEKQTCTAFPTGIPDDIWWNRVDHREPAKGDHGIRWAPAVEGVGYPNREAL